MLIQFAVENHASLRDRQVLSLVGQTGSGSDAPAGLPAPLVRVAVRVAARAAPDLVHPRGW